METKKQKSQLRMEEESEAIEQKSQLPTEKGSESTKPASVIFTFYKFLEFLGMLYNSIWVGLGLLLNVFKMLETIKMYIYIYIYISFLLLLVMYLEWIKNI